MQVLKQDKDVKSCVILSVFTWSVIDHFGLYEVDASPLYTGYFDFKLRCIVCHSFLGINRVSL